MENSEIKERGVLQKAGKVSGGLRALERGERKEGERWREQTE